MNADLSDIVEVRTCSRKKVNGFLDAGFRLLAVECESLWTDAPKKAQEKGVPGYVLRHLVFVVGRPEGVEPFDPDKASAEADA